jgi:glucokinase
MAFYEDGEAAGRRVQHASRAQEGVACTLAVLAQTIREAAGASESPPSAVGIAIPGHVDDVQGVVRWAPNFGETIDGVFRHWLDVPVRRPLSQSIDLPIVMGNDANLAALGEYRYGTGRNSATCLVMLTLGTGIGGGVVMAPTAVQGDAKGPLLLLGGNKGGAELGHMVIQHGGLDCPAGSYGAVEAYCQRDSVVRRAVFRLNRGRESMLSEMVEGDLSKLTPKLLSEAALACDEVAIEVLEEVGAYLGVAIGNCINIFAPEVVAVGGQMSKAGEWLLRSARRTARNVAIPSLFADATITLARHGEDAGMLGAAALAFGAC